MVTGVKRLEVDMAETDLSLAFELNMEQLSQQQVFAFLPLRKYGLRFIVQVRSTGTFDCCETTSIVLAIRSHVSCALFTWHLDATIAVILPTWHTFSPIC